jgi:hypothetical protein
VGGKGGHCKNVALPPSPLPSPPEVGSMIEVHGARGILVPGTYPG